MSYGTVISIVNGAVWCFPPKRVLGVIGSHERGGDAVQRRDLLAITNGESSWG